MKRTSNFLHALFSTITSILIASAFCAYGMEYDTSGFWLIGFISGMFMVIGARAAADTCKMYKEGVSQ